VWEVEEGKEGRREREEEKRLETKAGMTLSLIPSS
jgi:hypothetical protein